MLEIFRLLDLDHNNSIDSDELATMLRTVGMPADANRIRTILDEVDKDASGTVEFPEFAHVMRQPIITKYSRAEIHAAFRTVNAALGGGLPLPKGHIQTSTLKRAFAYYGSHRLGPHDAQLTCDKLDPDRSGLVNFDLLLRGITVESSPYVLP